MTSVPSAPPSGGGHVADGNLHVISLHPEVEQLLMDAAMESERIGAVVIDPRFTQEFLARLEQTLRSAYASGTSPVLLVPTPIRFFVKRLAEPSYPNLAVMAYTEVGASVSVQAAGTVVIHGFAQEREAVS